MSPNIWRIELFGALCARRDRCLLTHFKTQKTGALLAYLAAAAQPSYRREELIDRFWPEDALEAGRLSLRVALHTLRTCLETPTETAEPVLLTNRTSVQLNPTAYTTDKAEFETSLQHAGCSSDEETQKAALLKAISLYRGELLPGYDDFWIMGERQRLADAYLMALRRLIRLLAKAHAYDAALQYAQRAIQADPFREESHRTLMRLYLQIGRPAAALRQYQELQHLLKSELNTAPSSLTRQLVEPFIPHRAGSAPETSNVAESLSEGHVLWLPLPSESATPPPRPTGNVPAPSTPLFGREGSLATVRQMVETPETRLVTLTGGAGCGKTRLALAVANALQGTYPGGVWWVPLASVSDPQRILDAIGDALELPRSPEGSRADQVIQVLSAQPVLLVLDNFEHLAEEGAPSVQALLDRIPTLNCLVTSRQRLKLTSEYEYLVRPLTIPSLPQPLARLQACPSVQLFVDRARTVYPAFLVTEDNAEAVARICARLEGLPLAVELAATWTQTLTPAQIEARLATSFRLLVNRNRNIPARHASLQAAFDWSIALLAPQVQHFFAALSVFRGGWTLDAAEMVCQEANSLEYLTQLRERSLLMVEETEGDMRFYYLEALRDYAAERLEGAVRIPVVERHAAYYAELAAQAAPSLRGPEALSWLVRLEREHENLRAALAYLLENAEAGLRLATCLRTFWYLHGHADEGYRWLDQALRTCPQAPIDVQAQASLGAGNLAYSQGDFLRAQAMYERALALRRALGDRHGLAAALGSLGLVANDQADYSTAQQRFEEALALFRTLEDAQGIAVTLANLARVTCDRGDYQAARPLYAECLQRFRAAGDTENIVTALNNWSHAILHCPDYLEARPLLDESLALSHRMEYALGFAQCLAGWAFLALRLQLAEPAAVLLGAAEAIWERLGVQLTSQAQSEQDRLSAALRQTLSAAALATARSRGRTLTWDELCHAARDVVAEPTPN